MKTVIIGAGASGLACAIRLKQNIPSARVTVLERLETPGKKILATGNGRCNITNKNAIGYKTAAAFFEGLGLMLRSEEGGRVYPYSQKAETVLAVLLDKCKTSATALRRFAPLWCSLNHQAGTRARFQAQGQNAALLWSLTEISCVRKRARCFLRITDFRESPL